MIQKSKFAIFAISLSGVLLFTFFFNYPQCLAENIYYKDGRTIKAQIVNRTKDTIWVQQGEGAIGIDAKDISKITNKEGRVSKYDVGYLVDKIQDLLKEKKYIEAEESCTSLLQVFPDNVNVRYLRGMLNQKIGNTSKAIEDYSFLISHKDADGAIFNNLGTINAQLNKYVDAEDLFYKAINCNPKMAEFHNNLSELFVSLKNYDQAIEEYNNVLNLEPDNLVALFNLGVIYKDKGDYRQAGKQWQRILAVKPDDLDAKKALLSLANKK
jgi:tetratricopeptide (TPR) repeat protein